ncbi:hypothetical protein KJ742_04575 [Patescibacteria group bacterium]|nr:hypothetical protein [Patescibacteria group bacterium]MBU1683194.1 hypothetical protein [Patescibacteria group bacterium]MBU1935558.1 hypothetical protein [Patescibacteria group bacterium]
MATSIFLAKLIGLIYLVLGVGLAVNPKYYHKMFNDLLNDTPLMYLSGILAFIGGLLLVIFHNVWVESWAIVITVFGWLLLIKGALLIMFPSTMKKISRSLFQSSDPFLVDSLIIIILGLIFAYFGFLA